MNGEENGRSGFFGGDAEVEVGDSAIPNADPLRALGDFGDAGWTL